MTNTLLRAGALSCALLTCTAMCTQPALAQTAPPPRFQEVDANGVDLISGRFVFGVTEGSIGSGPGAVSILRSQSDDYGRTDQWSGLLYRRDIGGVPHMIVQFGGRSDTFTISGSSYTATKANGATLTGGSGSFTYRAADGTTVDYSGTGPDLAYPVSGPGCTLGDAGTCAVPVAVTRPDGTAFALNWTFVERCAEYDEQLVCVQPAAYARFEGAESSTGYYFTFTHATNVPGGGSASAPQPNWFARTGATFNNAVNPISTPPSISYSGNSFTDMGGGTWTVTQSGNLITGIRRPGSSADDISVSYAAGGIVSAVTRDGVTTGYSRSVSGNLATTTITDALSEVTIVVADLVKERVTSITDPLGRTTSFAYDGNSRLTRTTRPEGNYVELSYDARGNVVETVQGPKTGSAILTSSASYDSTCTNPVTCNQPNSVTDARGNTTDFTYDATHGGLLTATAPAPSGSGDRPQTRYGYTLTNGEYRLTSVSACASGVAPGCVGTAAESRTLIGYDAQGQVTALERRDGTGTLSATTTATYTPMGDVETVDGPLAGSADTSRLRYDAARRVVGVIGPDPDGSGALPHRATRTSYRSDGLPTSQERGTVTGQSDGDWAAFSAAERVETDYDANDRPVVQRLVNGSTTYALTQTSYDALGRPNCTAQRMNPAEYASLPSDACTLDTEGSFGPDRITRTTRDEAGQVTLVESGVGSSAEADEVATAWTGNGRIAHVTDAEGNRTTYEYDAYDRLQLTLMPSPTTDGTSSATDFVKYQYDDGGNVIRIRRRDGSNTLFTYDALNRATLKDLPGAEPDVDYTYDLLGRLTGASTSAQTLSFTFDALGRNLTQTGPQGTVASAYDSAGRRTRLTYPGSGLYVDYDYLVTGETSHLRENGATSGVGVLATFAYDSLGRRTSLTRGNGAVTSYDYDAVSRLDELVQNLSGSTNDLTLAFTHNPASQIATNTRSNDAYSFTGLANGSVADTHNGLNQVTATGATAITHDARGNISAIGSDSYGYSSENLLTNGPNGVTLAYDPLLRLYETAGSATTRFAYDGLALIAEHDGSNTLLRRYVHGPGVDEPLVQYEGSGTSDRRFLHADERGSIVSITDSAGALVGTLNRYDEYGRAQGTMNGRFGYTGQTWLPELNLWYYKARMYNPGSPTAPGGRFMQTDPIGYGAGMNLYAYVSGDPINRTDPSGLQAGSPPEPPKEDIVTVTGIRFRTACDGIWINNGGSTFVCSTSENWTLTSTTNWSHEFMLLTWLGPITQCTPQQFDEELNGHRYPTQDPNEPVGREPSRAQVIGVSIPIGSISIVIGAPITTSSPEPFTYVNQTRFGHPFHQGDIVRVGFEHLGWYGVLTKGSGSNYNPYLAGLNDSQGPIAFTELDNQLREAMETGCGTNN